MASTATLEFEKPIVELEKKIEEMKALTDTLDIQPQISDLEQQIETLRSDIYRNLTRWQRVQIARHPDRPYTLDYISHCFNDFVELHGDRAYKDDPAIVGGLATLNGRHVMVIGHQKGRDTKSNLYRNFGMPNPEGYRKAYRLFQQAEKFGLPVICFLDTPGAFPGLEAEERGQAEAIARNLLLMSQLKTPIIIMVIGEGASGGALGIGIGNRILMLENAWYSVIAPESCSSILWRSWDYKEQAAEALRLGATDLIQVKVIDRIVPEPIGGAHRDPETMFQTVIDTLTEELDALSSKSKQSLVNERRQKFYEMGVWTE
ncbi:MAG: acetyl-CoA carboxylase carboxyltransferase subunit alpha [Ignavibacteria bacterium]|mgnify:FL=1|nr:acetyl-CoA carboxylase carboxyltransferase subunit alpha [Ignavibacteria bacterium]MBP6510372.1 acetyl-CoA carboxylase carboxyltransferase subunit alpha [Candidatus Kapabacteria bacterium]MBK6760530.1 acetyl-CoA carboxylase carboxyltransferase subunit alpha [Ignavibacteria bacterium]MBK7032488.1 acetyl-CoA carboxylase carboxyltransferase subunit alpha [Ignavibacteria bacterium]MBK7186029.1 acetyl-CoA carboxylase carboxyltransferase subunit alpha [Ignavibacteria bacterium]